MFWLNVLLGLIFSFHQLCFGQSDPLPSWNDGHAKQAIIHYIQDTTSPNSKDYIPPEERIATFDQDGTLWVEKPIYTQFVFAIDTVKSLAKEHPEWKEQEPFKAVLEGNFNKIQTFTIQNIEKIVAAIHSGLTTDEYLLQVDSWLKMAIHPRYKRPYTDLIYQPMLELIQYLKKNGFKVYIVSGGGQDFIRAYGEKIYSIPPEQTIGSAGKVKYEYQNGQPILVKLPSVLFINDKSGKPEAIHFSIGRQPVASFGNSIGDKEMLEWSQGSKRKSLQLLVHHDDATREYAYDKDSKIGTFSEDLMQEAKENGWIVVSMKNDWKVVFPWEKA